MTVRGWLILGRLGATGLPPERFKGGYDEWPDAADFSRGDWIHFLAGPASAVAVCVEVPL